jgi:hypothetical protein
MWKAGPGVLQSGRTSRSTPDASRFAANRRELDGQGGFIHHHGPIDQDLQRLHTLLQLPVVDGTGSHPPPDAAVLRCSDRTLGSRMEGGEQGQGTARRSDAFQRCLGTGPCPPSTPTPWRRWSGRRGTANGS